mmetsp:Transcript_34669/g.62919  ORF Transcript_34669/g.62919 Transcript_34669/m.62919 type:complete len:214 (-) Transcript_34669:126-767(-)|eukprot:CAMPEP_0197662840 /NCGR_PEP_ID=MMETSP1338-20131121/54982_1 /TAXON_ID=43686 ORGANISM="Pelagodinium beii, Strain RCC1491" /NCGR_SAMPLE_ID=MMETSP1338 /ASSEMBLY_ACC=CAM_ASM_000754 /LENGTH=213 /DNA_ID=CAMNT_0043240877 /DNA_START=34 /DNA_END=675 /DNA_ORIENTATION=+
MDPRGSSPRPLLLLAVVLIVGRVSLEPFLSLTFAGEGGPQTRQLSQSRSAEQTAGFGKKEKPKWMKRKKVKMETLQADHGDKAETVAEVLAGRSPAQTPEDMVRARFSAARAGDGLFLAKTEIDMAKKLERRAKQWLITLGRATKEETGEYVDPTNTTKNLQSIERFEYIGTEENKVEFKVHCTAGILHETSIFLEDETYGWVYNKPESMDWL